LVAACTIWNVGTAPPSVTTPVTADAFALVLTREFDPLSPPA
jgi:Na+/H+ antiporter NhaB